MRATGSHDLKIVNARVTDEQMIGRGAPSPRTTGKAPANAWFICTVGAVYLGVAQAALDFAADYAAKRVPTALGKPIAELESIQRRLRPGRTAAAPGQGASLQHRPRLGSVRSAAG